MRVLLDTHTFVWFEMDNPELSARARSVIEDVDNEVLLSAASCWELAIKVSLGKMDLDGTPEEIIVPELTRNALSLLPIEILYLAKLAGLPYHHRDPFDRLLASQCLVLNVPIVSKDRAFDAYGIERIW